MDQPDQFSADTERWIDQDLSCLQCGYNLRTCCAEDVCPECGAAVEATLNDRLDLADARWLGRIRNGLAWLIIGGVGVLVHETAIKIIMVSTTPTLHGWPHRLMLWLLPLIVAGYLYLRYRLIAARQAGLVYLAIHVLLWLEQHLPWQSGVLGAPWEYWLSGAVPLALVTRGCGWMLYRQPGREEPPRDVLWRWAVWPALVGVCCVLPVKPFVRLGWVPPNSMVAVHRIEHFGWVVLVAAMLCLGRGLALRMAAMSLARHCRIVAWGYAVSAVVLFVIGMTMTVFRWMGWWTVPTAPASMKKLLLMGVLLELPLFVFGTWALVIAVGLLHRIPHSRVDDAG